MGEEAKRQVREVSEAEEVSIQEAYRRSGKTVDAWVETLLFGRVEDDPFVPGRCIKKNDLWTTVHGIRLLLKSLEYCEKVREEESREHIVERDRLEAERK